jgi:ectoine utilization protein EutC
MKITILTEPELRKCVAMDEDAFKAVADGFSRLAEGKATVPPIVRVDVPENDGEVDIKTAYVHGLDNFAVKIASGFMSNRDFGLPTGSGMMILVSTKTGFVEAILLDNGYLTDVRTGIAGSIASQYLACKQIETVGVIGSGTQARYQMRGVKLVRDFNRLLIYGIIPEEVDIYVDEMSEELGVKVIKASSYEQVVRESDVVVTATPSHEPYLRAEWLHPGLHITCMGSDAEHKQELHADVFNYVDRVVCDRKSQCFRLGELHHALEAGVISEGNEIIELGELTSGQKSGRQSDDEITVCDLTGVGVQDTAIARLAYQRAQERKYGILFGE